MKKIRYDYIIICTLVLLGISITCVWTAVQTFIMISNQGLIIYTQLPLPWLHADGKYIKDEYGNIVRLTGINWEDLRGDTDPLREPDGYYYRSPLSMRVGQAKEMGVNVIRLAIRIDFWKGWGSGYDGWGPVWWNGNPSRTEEYKRNVDATVEALAARRIYVFLTLPMEGTDGYLRKVFSDDFRRQEYIDWLKEVAQRYRSMSNVFGYELWNEPGWGNFTIGDYNGLRSFWWQFMLDSSKAIHEVNPRGIVIITFGGYFNKRSLDWFWENPLPEPNIMYNFHWYYRYESYEPYYKSYASGNYTAGKLQLEQYFYNRALKILETNYPLICSEFGFYNNEIEEPSALIVMRDTLDIFKNWTVHWTYFNWGVGIERDFVDINHYGILVYDKNLNYYVSPYDPSADPRMAAIIKPKFDAWQRNLELLPS